MIIDFHTHAFPDEIALKTVEFLKSKSKTEPFTDGKYSSLSKRASVAGVTLSMVLPVVTSPKSASKINIFASNINEVAGETGVFSFGGIHPDCENYKEILNEIFSLGLKGVKIHPAYQQTPLNDIKYKRIIGYAEEKGLIVITHGGKDIGIEGDYASPKMSEEVLDEIKPKKFVMAHFGGWEQWEEVENRLIGRDIYLDTAFTLKNFNYQADLSISERQPVLDKDKFVKMVRAHGADKVLFGTDSPWGDQNEQIEYIRSLSLTETEKNKILGENAKGLL